MNIKWLLKFLNSLNCNSCRESSQSSDYELTDKIRVHTIGKKNKIYNLSRQHPNWSLKSLQKNGASCLSRKDELTRWKSEIVKGETKFDKIKNINDYVYKRFCEEREKYSCITTRNVRD